MTAGGDPEFSACLVAARGSLTLNLPADGQPSRAKVGATPWASTGEAHRAPMLLAEALSGLRVASEAGSETCTVSLLTTGKSAPAWKDLVSFRRPPAEYFTAQVARVDELLPLRETRLLEVHAQAGSAVAFLLSAAQLPVQRMPRTLEFLDAALALQMAVQMRVKHQLGCARPHEVAPSLLPMIDVPSHGSLPSGHAGESALVVALLSHLMAQGPASRLTMLRRMGLRIAENRVVAGVHFPVDSLAGRLLGEAVADYLLAGVGERAAVQVRRFGAQEWGQPADGLPLQEGDAHLSPECSLDGEAPAPTLADHRSLWELVKKEWA